MCVSFRITIYSLLLRYRDVLVTLLTEILKKIQFTYNQTELEELDNEELNEDVRMPFFINARRSPKAVKFQSVCTELRFWLLFHPHQTLFPHLFSSHLVGNRMATIFATFPGTGRENSRIVTKSRFLYPGTFGARQKSFSKSFCLRKFTRGILISAVCSFSLPVSVVRGIFRGFRRTPWCNDKDF